MANSLIQIKQSFTNTVPVSLNVGELAYSYVSNSLFIGTPDNAGYINIGGFSSLLRYDEAFHTANSAFIEANASFDHANAAFIKANSGYESQNSSGNYANAAFIRANNSLNANLGGQVTGITTFNSNTRASSNTTGDLVVVGGAAIKGNVYTGSIYITGNGLSGTQNAIVFGDGTTQNTSPAAIGLSANLAFGNANGAFAKSNAAYNHANAAFIRANNAVDANVGGTITATTAAITNASGALIVAGGVGIRGNVYTGSIVMTGNGVGGLSNTLTFPDGTVQNSSPVTIGNYANSAFVKTNSAFGHANAAYISQNATGQYANSAFAHANAAYISQNATGQYANAAFNQANSAFIKTNSAFSHANSAYESQNATGQYANAAYTRANNSLSANVGGTVTGDVTITGNLIVSGNTTYVNTTQALIADNILTLNAAINQASAPILNAGIEIDRGSAANVYVLWNETATKWTVTNDGTNYFNIGSDAAESYANSAFIKANSSFDHANAAYISQNATGQYANSAFIQANAAFGHANAAYQSQNATGQYANSAFIQANSAFIHANSAYQSQNATGQYANSAFIQSNAAFGHANAAYISQNATGQYANAAFIRANNSLNANVGGQVTGDVTFVGNVTSNTITTTGSNGSISGANAIFTNYIFAANGNVDLYIYSSRAYANANAGLAMANAAFANANGAFAAANAAYIQANSAYQSQNATGNVANSGFIQSNAAFGHANAAYISQNATGQYANSAFVHANSAYQSQNATGQYANSAFIKANASFDHANAAYISQNATGQYANAAFTLANGAFIHANSGFIQSNSAFIHANSSYATANVKTQTFVQDTSPASANVDDIWIDSSSGIQYVYINSNSSNQWVEFSAYSSPLNGTANIQFADQTIFTVNSAQDLVISNPSTANIKLISGNTVITGNLIADATGKSASFNNITAVYFRVNTATTIANTAAVNIVGSTGYYTQVPTSNGYMMQITGNDNSTSRVVNDSAGVGSYSAFIGRHARGTHQNPTAAQANDLLARFSGNGYGVTGYGVNAGGASMDVYATENYTDTSRGSKLVFSTTANGTNVRTVSATMDANTTTFVGTVAPQKGFIYPTRTANVGNSVAVTIDFANDAIVRCTVNADMTVYFTNYTAGKIVDLWLTNLSGTNKTVTHGVSGLNATNNGTTKTVPGTSTAKFQFYSIDGDLANTFVAITQG